MRTFLPQCGVLFTCLPHTGLQCKSVCPTLRCNAAVFAARYGVLLMCEQQIGAQCEGTCPMLAPRWLWTFLPRARGQCGAVCPTQVCVADVSAPRCCAMQAFLPQVGAEARC